MAKGKKYDYRAIQGGDDATWTGEITRQVTSKEIVVSKSQGGFATESEALEWGQEAIKSFVKQLTDQNSRRNEAYEEKMEKARIYRANKKSD